MIRKPVVLITGAGGEIGHGLIAHLAQDGRQPVITLDVNPLEPALAKMVQREFTGSIMDKSLLERMLSEFEVETVYHLAALLSTRSEFTPVTAHQVNVEGTLNLLEFSQREAESHGRPVCFLYPSSIAAYGLPDLETKRRAGKVKEDDHNTPSTMYGANKLYCEQLGRYYAKFYKQLAAAPQSGRVDFWEVDWLALSLRTGLLLTREAANTVYRLAYIVVNNDRPMLYVSRLSGAGQWPVSSVPAVPVRWTGVMELIYAEWPPSAAGPGVSQANVDPMVGRADLMKTVTLQMTDQGVTVGVSRPVFAKLARPENAVLPLRAIAAGGGRWIGIRSSSGDASADAGRLVVVQNWLAEFAR